MTVSTTTKHRSEYFTMALGLTCGVAHGFLSPADRKEHALEVATVTLIGYRHLNGLTSQNFSMIRLNDIFAFSFNSASLATRMTLSIIKKLQKPANVK